MGLFSKKEKYEPKGKPLDFDPLNVQIRDLRPGFFVDYNFKTFEITGGFEFSLKEYSFKALKFDAADQILWILIENGMDTFIMEQHSLAEIDPGMQDMMSNFAKAPSGVTFKGNTFSLVNQGDGKFRDLSKNAMDWNRLTCWKFQGGEGNSRVYALQKGQGTFEAISAVSIPSGELSNFLPKI